MASEEGDGRWTLPTTLAQPADPPVKRVRRWRLASWAPVVVLVLLCAIITAINPNFLTFGNFVRISQAAMIPLVLGLGATFIILMGSIDLSVEGVLTLGAVILSMLVLNGANGNDLGLLGDPDRACSSAPASASSTASSTSACKIPSFMTTLGMWFIGVGVANALLGGIAVRINDPLIRGLAIERFLGFPGASGWRSAASPSPASSRTTRASAATSTRSAAARNWRRSPASRSPACAS